MRIGEGVRTGLGHGGITCVFQMQFSCCYCLADSSNIGLLSVMLGGHHDKVFKTSSSQH